MADAALATLASALDSALVHLPPVSFPDVSAELLLRFCVFCTFFGHGYLAATGGQQGWYKYLATAGFGRSIGSVLMRLIGFLDIALAFGALFLRLDHPLYPRMLAWCAAWGLSTAAMRPLSGEHLMGLIERSGNWIPAVLLMYQATEGSKNTAAWQQNVLFIVLLLAGLFFTSVFFRITGIFADRKPHSA